MPDRELLLRTLFDDSPVAVLVCDRELRIVDCNRCFVEMAGAPRGEIVGTIIASLRTPGAQEAVQAALAGRHGFYEGPYAPVRIASERLTAIALHATPLRSSEGAVVGAVLMISNLTAQYAAEAQHAESEQRYRAVVELSPEPVFVHEGGRFLYANPAALRAFGVARLEDLLARPTSAFVHPTVAPAVDSRLEQIERGATVQFMDQKFVRADGTEGDAEVASAPIHFEGRSAVLTVARDVSARLRLEEELRQAHKMEAVGLLAGGIAHDFNNMLTVAAAYSDRLQRALPPEDPRQADVEEIRQASERAAHLTRQLLAFGRKQVLLPRFVDVRSVLGGLESMLRRLLGEDIRVVLELPEGPQVVHADPGQLEQVIVNLAVNARDAMPQGGTLTLSLSPGTAEQIVLSVRDTGQGMDRATRERVFEPFFTTKGPGRGTGLGLSTVYGIVRQSGGTIRVESAPGKGAFFEVRLPRAHGGEEAAAPSRRSTPDPKSEGAVVLLLEDDDGVRRALVRMLELSGHTVLVARDGDEALRVAAAHPGPIQLLVSDVIMPGIGGPAVHAKLLESRPGLAVLYVSGYPDAEIFRRGKLPAGADLLEKPFTAGELQERIQKLLRRR